MSVLFLAFLGGLVSFLSTSVGVFASFMTSRTPKSYRWNLSLDFALGLMVSASAFTLIGPAALHSPDGEALKRVMMATLVGILFVMGMKFLIDFLQRESPQHTTHFLLASMLMLHNFPEGLASGAALAGLGWLGSWPILGGISIQNIPEGALMVFCLRALGWKQSAALLGGIGSGVVELSGGVLAGFVLQSVENILPLLLSSAGGAMITSVALELSEGEGKVWRRILSRQFLIGFISLPLIQYFGT